MVKTAKHFETARITKNTSEFHVEFHLKKPISHSSLRDLCDIGFSRWYWKIFLLISTRLTLTQCCFCGFIKSLNHGHAIRISSSWYWKKDNNNRKKLVFLSAKLQHGSKLGEKEVVAKVAVCNPVVSL